MDQPKFGFGDGLYAQAKDGEKLHFTVEYITVSPSDGYLYGGRGAPGLWPEKVLSYSMEKENTDLLEDYERQIQHIHEASQRLMTFENRSILLFFPPSLQRRLRALIAEQVRSLQGLTGE